VRWQGRPRRIFCQDGPVFILDRDTGESQTLAVYDNGLPAAVVARFGDGAVGVVGPHPEATPEWFAAAGLPPPRPPAVDLAHDLVDTVMRA
jgi:glutamine amidotransferase-like uncharacterized protein